MPYDHGSRALLTKGSYSVAIGISRSPHRDQVAPSSPSRHTRFTSAMPNSMCWPVGASDHLRTLSVSSANQSRRSLTDHTPVLLIQPPKLVDDATSGLHVTNRALALGASRDTSARSRPNTACVEI